jgi:phospholipid-translocating ATPase
MNNKTWISALGWILSVAGWTLWNVVLSAIYSTSQSVSYAVRSGFIRHFGGSGHWWLVIILVISAVLVFELALASLKKIFWPSDVDIWQVLEKDKAIRQRLEDADPSFSGATTTKTGRGRAGQDDSCGDGESEREIRELLTRPRSTMVPLEPIITAGSAEAERAEMAGTAGGYEPHQNRHHASIEQLWPRAMPAERLK